MTATYKITVLLDLYNRTCLFAGNPAAKEKFGYNIDYRDFGLPADLIAEIDVLRAEYAALFENDQEATQEQSDAFCARLEGHIPRIQAALGPDFEVVPD